MLGASAKAVSVMAASLQVAAYHGNATNNCGRQGARASARFDVHLLGGK